MSSLPEDPPPVLADGQTLPAIHVIVPDADFSNGGTFAPGARMSTLSSVFEDLSRLDPLPDTLRRLLGVRREQPAGAYGFGPAVQLGHAGASSLLRGTNLPAYGGWPGPESGRDAGVWPGWLGASHPPAMDSDTGAGASPVVTHHNPPCIAGEAGRVETKYCVPPDVAARVMRLASSFLEPDRHQATAGFQRITSLYLDTQELLFLRWTRERQGSRFKLRIRAYGEGTPTAVYAEIKSKERGIGRKRRALLQPPYLGGGLEGSRLSDVPLPDDDGRLQEFVWRSRRFGAEPKVLIRCERLALRGSYPGDETAVTMDRHLEYQPARDLVGEPWAWQPVRLPQRVGADGVVLEFKHASQTPIWMTAVERRLRPWRRSFSKYKRAMSQMPRWECW